MSNLIGKRIEAYIDTAHGDKTPFVADVKPGRREGEIFLTPVGDHPPGAKGYVSIGVLYVRRLVEVEPAPAPANVTPLPASPVEASDPVVPAADAPVEAAAPAAEGDAPTAGQQPELTDGRRLSENPISASTRRSRGRGGALDHGANAETPDAFQPKS